MLKAHKRKAKHFLHDLQSLVDVICHGRSNVASVPVYRLCVSDLNTRSLDAVLVSIYWQ